MKVKSQDVQTAFPVSKLVWLGKAGDFTSIRKKEMEAIKSIFPKFELEQFEIKGNNEKDISKKVALHFMKWADECQLEQMGLFCQEPVGFPDWASYIDFVRKDPPALLWKTHATKTLEVNKILIPVDFSSGTERVLSFLKKTFKQLGEKEITLLNIFDNNHASSSPEEIATIRQEKIDNIKWFIEANMPAEIRSKLAIDAQPKLESDKVDSLYKYIEFNNTDLVILGSHNFNHYHYLLYGSMSEAVLSQELPIQVCVLFK